MLLTGTYAWRQAPYRSVTSHADPSPHPWKPLRLRRGRRDLPGAVVGRWPQGRARRADPAAGEGLPLGSRLDLSGGRHWHLPLRPDRTVRGGADAVVRRAAHDQPGPVADGGLDGPVGLHDPELAIC